MESEQHNSGGHSETCLASRTGHVGASWRRRMSGCRHISTVHRGTSQRGVQHASATTGGSKRDRCLFRHGPGEHLDPAIVGLSAVVLDQAIRLQAIVRDDIGSENRKPPVQESLPERKQPTQKEPPAKKPPVKSKQSTPKVGQMPVRRRVV